jgi:RNA polymerase sigma factor (sigma-70 family)
MRKGIGADPWALPPIQFSICIPVRFILPRTFTSAMTDSIDDQAALREYAQSGSQAAFAALVGRHIDWVYSTALRQVRNAAMAEDITQAAFLLLARKAGQISNKSPVSAWLFRVVLYEARALQRSERRRQSRERQAAMRPDQTDQTPSQNDLWLEIAPQLDEAVSALSQTDQRSILLRFYQRMTFADIGAATNVSEEAARKRVERAVAKLRSWFSRRGVETRMDALSASLLGSHLIQQAPGALSTKVMTIAATAHSAAPAVVKLAAWAQKAILHAQLRASAWVLTIGTTVAVAAGGTAYMVTLLAEQTPPPSQSPASAPTASPAAAAQPIPPIQPLTETATFTGRMLDPDGKPAPDVKIWPLVSTSDYFRYYKPATPLTTAADGSFSITVTQYIGPDQPNRTPQLQIIYHGNVWGGAQVIGTNPQDIPMPRPTKMRAVLLDPNQNPVAGMKVGIERITSGFPNEIYLENLPANLAELLQKTTDASGAAEWDDLPREWTVSVDWLDPRFARPFDDGEKPTADAELSSDLVVHLHTGASIHGRVTYGPAGPPAAGIQLRTAGQVTQGDITGFVNATAVTDADGKYAFDQLLAGSYPIVLDLAPDGPLEKQWTTAMPTPISVARGQTLENQDIVLIKGGAISGTVTDAQTGVPIARAYLAVEPQRGAVPGTGAAQAETDENGRYTLHVPPGKFTLTLAAMGNGYAPTEVAPRSIDVPDGQTLNEDFMMQHGPPLMKSGRVTFQDGSPAIGAKVLIVAEQGWTQFQTTDLKGRFPMEPQETNLYHARFGAMDSKSIVTSKDDIDLVLQPGLETEIAGKVVAADGTPIAGASVTAWLVLDRRTVPGNMQRETDARGAFRFRDIWPDVTYRLLISAEGYAEITKTITAGGQASQPLTFRLEKADAVIRGRALGPDGRGLAGMEVSVVGRSTVFHSVITDETGAFVLNNIARNDRVRITVRQNDVTIGDASVRGSANKLDIQCKPLILPLG